MPLSNAKDDALNTAEILGSLKCSMEPYSSLTSDKQHRTKKRKKEPSKSTSSSASNKPGTAKSSSSGTTPANANANGPADPNSVPKAYQKPNVQSDTTTSTDIYDAMLGEISDLLMAASQAQSLGRLKMASTYQLLVHARLVGLGKRFDRFLAHGEGSGILSGGTAASASASASSRSLTFPPSSITNTNSNTNHHHHHPPPSKSSHGTGGTPIPTRSGSNPSSSTATAASTAASGTNPPPAANHPHVASSDIQQAQATLAKILPNEIDLDNTMMEHLARAAMELHNKRTGRGLLHERTEARRTSMEGMGSGNSSGSTTAAAAAAAANSNHPTPYGVAWTDAEKARCVNASLQYGREEYDSISRYVGTRTSAEVRAHLKNLDGREKIQMNLDPGGKNDGSAGAGGAGSGAGAGGNDATVTPEKQRRGRGKKPPSRAMLTVSSAVFDAKKMVSGAL